MSGRRTALIFDDEPQIRGVLRACPEADAFTLQECGPSVKPGWSGDG